MGLHCVYFSLGTNMGDREANIANALSLLAREVGAVTRRSSLYETEPWGFASSHLFINACALCETSLSPRRVLQATQQIERRLGRREKSVGGVYHDRIIDIDILLYDRLHLLEPGLQIPHPHMRERDFVMQPLREILGDYPL